MQLSIHFDEISTLMKHSPLVFRTSTNKGGRIFHRNMVILTILFFQTWTIDGLSEVCVEELGFKKEQIKYGPAVWAVLL